MAGFFTLGSAQAADLWQIASDALDEDAGLSSALSGFSAVQAARDVRRGTLLPQLSVGGNVAHTRIYETDSSGSDGNVGDVDGASSFGDTDQDDAFNSIDLSLDATQALFDRELTSQVERAEREIDRESLAVLATEQQLLFEVATAYFDILRNHDILAARRAEEAAIGRQQEQAQERFEVGLIAITDVLEAQASFDLAQAQRIAAENAMQVSFEALERLTGQRYESIEGLAEDIPITLPEPAGRDDWVAMAMESSPLVRQAEANIAVARSTLDVSRAGELPTVEAFASVSYADDDRSNFSNQGMTNRLGVRASMPLYTGGSTRAQIRESTFLLEVSQYDFEDQRRDTIQQVRSTFTRVNNDIRTVEVRAQAIVSNRSALEATTSGYEVGTRNIVDVLDAERDLFNAIADHAEARYDYVLGLLLLQQQAGVLDADSIQAVNAWLDADESVSLDLPEPAVDNAVMNIGERPRAPS
jgi:outer membrane protein